MKTVKITESQKEWVMILVIILFALFLGCFFVLRTGFKEISKVRIQISSAEERMKLIKEIKSFKDSSERMESTITTSSQRHLLLSKIMTVANKNNIDVLSLNPNIAESQNFKETSSSYEMLNIEMIGKAEYRGLMGLLKGVEKMSPELQYKKLDIKQPQSRQSKSRQLEEKPKLNFTLVFEALLLKDQ